MSIAKVTDVRILPLDTELDCAKIAHFSHKVHHCSSVGPPGTTRLQLSLPPALAKTRIREKKSIPHGKDVKLTFVVSVNFLYER